MIEAHKHRDVAAFRGTLRGEALQGHQARVHARQIVLTRGRDELALVAEETRPLAGVRIKSNAATCEALSRPAVRATYSSTLP